MVALARLRLLTRPHLPPTPSRPPPIDSIHDHITGTANINFIQKTSTIQVDGRNSYKMIAIIL